MLRHATKGGIVVEILMFVIAAGLLYNAVSAGFTTYKFLHMAQITEVEGAVTDVRDHGFTVAIQYVLPNGEKIDFTQNVLIPKYVKDNRVPVSYDPNMPTNARLDSFSAIWFHSIVFGIPGLILLIWGFSLHKERSL